MPNRSEKAILRDAGLGEQLVVFTNKKADMIMLNRHWNLLIQRLKKVVDLRQLNAWLCLRLHDIMHECFTRDLWEMRLFEFLHVATFI